MIKTVLAVLIFCIVQGKAFAMIPVDLSDYVQLTGNRVIQANDTGLLGNSPLQAGLGGEIGNQYILLKGFEFTVDRSLQLDYLSLNATAKPFSYTYETARSNYVSQRLAEGVDPYQIGIEVNGDGVNPPLFVGPSQSMDVNFSLIKGSLPLSPGLGEGQFKPTGDVLASSSYKFITGDSLNKTAYPDLLVPLNPFNTALQPNEKYWIVASDPKFSGITLNHTTGFAGSVTTPEPSSLLLLGGGLFGLYRRSRSKKTKA